MNPIVHRILISSPGDVESEREDTLDAISRLNQFIDKNFGIIFHPVSVEYSSHADSGVDAQALLNSQFGEYDLFLGIMWMRFGTETPRAGSGTEEEFNLALEHATADPSRRKLMFYFCEANPDFEDIEPGQYSKVKAFRRRVQDSKLVLYKTYSDRNKFEVLVIFDLLNYVSEVADGRQQADTGRSVSRAEVSKHLGVDSRLGYDSDGIEDIQILDILASAESGFTGATNALKTISEATERYVARMRINTDKTLALVNRKRPSLVAAKRIADDQAANIEEFCMVLQPSSEEMDKQYASAFENTIDGLTLLFSGPIDEDLGELISTVEYKIEKNADLMTAAIQARDYNARWIEILDNTPKQTRRMNRAVKSAKVVAAGLVGTLDNVVNYSEVVDDILQSAKRRIDGMKHKTN